MVWFAAGACAAAAGGLPKIIVSLAAGALALPAGCATGFGLGAASGCATSFTARSAGLPKIWVFPPGAARGGGGVGFGATSGLAVKTNLQLVH